MTREYAIELIKQEILDADDEYRYETQSVADYYEALEYAVNALECEKSMIDRVLEIIDGWKEFPMGEHKSVLNLIRKEVLALKGGEQE